MQQNACTIVIEPNVRAWAPNSWTPLMSVIIIITIIIIIIERIYVHFI